MDRAEQLRKLSSEHHSALVMARKIKKIAENGTEKELEEAIQSVQSYYDNELEVHFQHEEHTIFKPLFQEYREHVGLATQLVKEHGVMRIMIPSMSMASAKEDLGQFAEILKNHTKIEEQELFPLVEKLFSQEQMDAVLNFKPLD